MKSPKLKLGLPLTAATAVYIVLSLLGSFLYLALPPFLCSIPQLGNSEEQTVA